MHLQFFNLIFVFHIIVYFIFWIRFLFHFVLADYFGDSQKPYARSSSNDYLRAVSASSPKVYDLSFKRSRYISSLQKENIKTNRKYKTNEFFKFCRSEESEEMQAANPGDSSAKQRKMSVTFDKKQPGTRKLKNVSKRTIWFTFKTKFENWFIKAQFSKNENCIRYIKYL